MSIGGVREKASKAVVLVVDQYNTIRGPLVKGLLDLEREKSPHSEDVVICTAGTEVEAEGIPADWLTKMRAKNFGVDLSTHQSAKLTDRQLDAASLIIPVGRRIESDVVARSSSPQLSLLSAKMVVDLADAPPGIIHQIAANVWAEIEKRLFPGGNASLGSK